MTTTSLHLNDKQLSEIAHELDQIREQVTQSVGEKDAKYIRRVLAAVRYTELSGRALLFFGFFPPTWILGTLILGISKILENMELGHNVIHGQYDWMKDPELNGNSYEWDIAGTADNWRRSHNYKHHTYTNIKGLDDDIGYGILRLFPEQKWRIGNIFQPLYTVVFALFFQWGIAIQELKLGKVFKSKTHWNKFKQDLKPVLKKIRFQFVKDYLFFPIIAGPNYLGVVAGNFVANIIRNVWTFTVIFCGHFTKKVYLFNRHVIHNESKGHWYVRQILGSSNLSGGKLLHIMTGNLSHQIEHHLFPDIPARRYAEIAEKVRALCQKYQIQYNTGNMMSQFTQVIYRICRYSLPI